MLLRIIRRDGFLLGFVKAKPGMTLLNGRYEIVKVNAKSLRLRDARGKWEGTHNTNDIWSDGYVPALRVDEAPAEFQPTNALAYVLGTEPGALARKGAIIRAAAKAYGRTRR